METCFGKIGWRIRGKSGHQILWETVLIFACRSPTKSEKMGIDSATSFTGVTVPAFLYIAYCHIYCRYLRNKISLLFPFWILFSLSLTPVFYLILFCKTITEHFPLYHLRKFSRFATALHGLRPPHFWGFEITQRHTTVGRTPVDQWSSRLTELYFKTHNTHKRQTLMGQVELEPAIPPREWPQTYALDRAPTGKIFFYLQHSQCVKPATNVQKSNQLSYIWNCA
jgi:hypothetical protein